MSRTRRSSGRRARRAGASGPARRAGSLAASVLLTLSLAACAPDESPPVAAEVLGEGVDMAMTRMRTFVTREGVRRARLEADTAEFMNETEIHMRPVTLTFFDQDGREATVVTADFGIFYETTEDMEAHGSIVALDRRDDQRLETERLRYVASRDRLFGDVPFTFWRDGGRTVVNGSAFESDPGMDSLTVLTPSGQSEQRGPRPVPPPPAARPAAADTPRADMPPAEDPTPSLPPDTVRAQDGRADSRAARATSGGAERAPTERP